MLIRKPRCYAEVYNDLDGEMVNLFRVVRDTGEDLLRRLSLTPFARDEFIGSYEHIADNPVEWARRTIIRSFMGFGSNSINRITGFGSNSINRITGFRSNSDRSGTTPAHDWSHYPEKFGAFIERLQGVVIENRDASEVLLAHDKPSSLHYVDPPYLPETRDPGRDYHFELTEQQHIDLAKLLRDLEGAVIVSGYPSALYDEEFSTWDRVERAALADGARKRTEVLWMKGCRQLQGVLF